MGDNIYFFNKIFLLRLANLLNGGCILLQMHMDDAENAMFLFDCLSWLSTTEVTLGKTEPLNKLIAACKKLRRG